MKKIFIFVCTLSMLISCIVPVFADNAESSAPVVSYDLDESQEHESGTLPALVSRIFGTYTPRTQTVTVYQPDGTTIETTQAVSGLAGVDWYWISGVALFALVLWSFFRLIGVVFKHE